MLAQFTEWFGIIAGTCRLSLALPSDVCSVLSISKRVEYPVSPDEGGLLDVPVLPVGFSWVISRGSWRRDVVLLLLGDGWFLAVALPYGVALLIELTSVVLAHSFMLFVAPPTTRSVCWPDERKLVRYNLCEGARLDTTWRYASVGGNLG